MNSRPAAAVVCSRWAKGGKTMAQMHEVEATVLAQETVGPACYRLSLFAPRIAALAAPGQFVQVACGTGYDPLLRRPLTVYRCRRQNDGDLGPTVVELVYKVRGRGTGLLCMRRPGDSVSVLGPLGHGFSIDRSAGRHILIGAGMGATALMALAGAITGDARRSVVEVLLGAHTEEELLCLDDWRSLSGLALSTWLTRAGLEKALQALAEERRNEGNDVSWAVYSCGPRPFLRRVAGFAAAEALPCQVSLEVHMACGVGACQSCVCETWVRPGQPGQGVKYSLTCKQGPVFRAQEVVWGERS